MNGSEFIALAGRLALAQNSDEACFRSATSRAYYGAFHLAKGFLQSIGVKVPEGAQAHGRMPMYLKESGHIDARTAGSLLEDLHGDRIQADYKLDNTEAGSKSFAQLKLATARRIESKLNACRAAGSTIGLAINQWKRSIHEP